MGAEIHLFVEVREVVEWNRPDREVRALQREAESGDPSAREALAGAALWGPWELGACELFGAGEVWLQGGYPLESAEESAIREWALARLGQVAFQEEGWPVFRRTPGLPLGDASNDRLFTILGRPPNSAGLPLIAPDHGLPGDLAEVTRLWSKVLEPNDHASWVGADELLDFAQEHPATAQDLAQLGANEWIGVHGMNAVRYLYWFDE